VVWVDEVAGRKMPTAEGRLPNMEAEAVEVA